MTRGPYLQMARPTAQTVRWRTDSARTSRVIYGTAPGTLNQTASVAGTRTEHEVQLTGLSPDTQYYYAIGDDATIFVGGDHAHRFRTRLWQAPPRAPESSCLGIPAPQTATPGACATPSMRSLRVEIPISG